MRRFIQGLAIAAFAALSFAQAGFAADGKVHRIAIQVDQNDPAIMNLALNNVTNIIEYYRNKGEDVDVDLVTYGPGLNMLREDTSPVKDRIKHLKDFAFPGKISSRPATTPSRAWRRRKATPSRSSPRQPSSPPAWCG